MSKASLRKELKNMSREQLEQIILDAYDARAEIKEYLEFFLNPDVDRLMKKHLEKVEKELRRYKWGSSKMRVSVIKKLVKDFEGFQPGFEHVMRMLSLTVQHVCLAEKYYGFNASQEALPVFLLRRMLTLANEANAFDTAVEAVNRIVNHPQFTNHMHYVLQSNLQDISMSDI